MKKQNVKESKYAFIQLYENLIDNVKCWDLNYSEPIVGKMVYKEKKLINKTKKLGKRLNKLYINSTSKQYYFMEILNFKQFDDNKNLENISNTSNF